MTILLRGQVFGAKAFSGITELSSRPQRSWASGPTQADEKRLLFSNSDTKHTIEHDESVRSYQRLLLWR
jgi:hypothetical protein